MKSVLPLLICFIAALFSCSSEKESRLEVLSLNIRYDNPADAPNDWPARKNFVLSFLEDENPAIFGLQEALWHQYTFLDSALVSYESIAAGRDDGKRSGEMTPVFYSKDRFGALNSGTFWLSETPAIPGSRGPGAVLPRIVTWVQLQDKQAGSSFFLFNTHYSHMSDSARLMSSEIIRREVRTTAGNYPFIITGDFNMLPGSRAYEMLTEEGAEGALIIDAHTVSENEPSGLSYTFNGFRDEEGKGRIDYIFVSPGIDVRSHEIQAVKQDGLFISDHWPVKASVVLPGSEQ